ncbi:MAG: FAD-dependent oxidoreductase [Thermodesulfobacteriota bacterium]
MKRLACIDPERIVPISRSDTLVFKTGTWSSRRPSYSEKVSPCRVACPAGNNIPRALYRASLGDFDGALQAFLEESSLPGVCGRVCYHPCEGRCNRGEWDAAVRIGALERSASELGDAEPEILTRSGAEHPVAVVGSGPAGLSAAFHLARMGHPVTLLEAERELGGLLRWGIPEYRLPRHILERDLSRILSLGIQVTTGVEVDGAQLEGLRKAHGAVLLAAGAGKSRTLDIPGMDLSGVQLGVEFLKAVRKDTAEDLSGRVVVIGGGNVAVDAALSARRLGAHRVEMVCLEKPGEMPIHEREYQDALEEGVQFHHGWGPRIVLGNRERVTAVLFARCLSLLDGQGKFRPSYDEAVTMKLEADHVIAAIGQVPDFSVLGRGSSLMLGPEGGLQADPETLETHVNGVFAAGDAVRFPGSVVEAIAAGKRAALAIHLRSQGGSFPEPVGKVTLGDGPSFSIQAFFRPRPGWEPAKVVAFRDLEPLFLNPQPRSGIRRLPPEVRGRGFQEITQGLYPDEALTEAGRCFFCGTCTGCDRCYLFCPEVSILPPGEGRGVYEANPDYCKGCAVCAAVCPRGIMTMEGAA